MRVSLVTLNHLPHQLGFVRVIQLLQCNHLEVAAARKIARFVQHIGDAARHAGREVAPSRPEHDHAAAGHVLAAMIPDGFHHGLSAAVSHGEALTRHASDIRLASRRTVERHVADNDVLLRNKGGAHGRKDDEFAAR